MSDRMNVSIAIEKSDGKGGWTHVKQCDISEVLSRLNPAFRGEVIEQIPVPARRTTTSSNEDRDDSRKLSRIAKLVQLGRDLGYEDIETLVTDLRDSWSNPDTRTAIRLSSGGAQPPPTRAADEDNPESADHTKALARASSLFDSEVPAAEPIESLVSTAALQPKNRKQEGLRPNNADETTIKAEKRTVPKDNDDTASKKRRKISDSAVQHESADSQMVKQEPDIKMEDSVTSPRPLQYPETMIERSIIYPEEEEEAEEAEEAEIAEEQDFDSVCGENGSHCSRRSPSPKADEPRSPDAWVSINKIRRPEMSYKGWSCTKKAWQSYEQDANQGSIAARSLMRQYSIMGHIMETDAGVARKPGPCRPCQTRGRKDDLKWHYECKVLSDSARALLEGGGSSLTLCAACIHQGKSPAQCV